MVACGCDEEDFADDVVRSWGGTGRGKGQFSYPRGMTFGRGDRLYIVDKAARVQCFTRKGEYLFEWKTPKSEFGKPIGMTTDKDGLVYVADTHYNRVMVYSPDGETVVRQFGRFGKGPGEFIFLTDVLVESDGTTYVSEYGGNDRVSKFDGAGNFLLSFGGVDAGQASLNRPESLAMDETGTIYVADGCNHRICRFGRDGKFLGEFGSLGVEPGMLQYPYGVELSPDGTLWVVEYGNNRIQQFTREGKSLRVWGRVGRSKGELAYPWAMLVTETELYVLDSGNNRVQVVRQ